MAFSMWPRPRASGGRPRPCRSRARRRVRDSPRLAAGGRRAAHWSTALSSQSSSPRSRAAQKTSPWATAKMARLTR
eukprot:9237998-Pyramimonas_sp.AAC.1